MIDVDGSPSGYVAWYNYYTNGSRIRTVRPAVKNDKFGIQRMEMLAIYFALLDNLHFRRSMSTTINENFVIDIRSDSKSTIGQLQGTSEVRDVLLHRICGAIKKLLRIAYYTILFNHLERTRNIAGLLLEQRRRKEKEQFILGGRAYTKARI
jgi:hypothetical protein